MERFNKTESLGNLYVWRGYSFECQYCSKEIINFKTNWKYERVLSVCDNLFNGYRQSYRNGGVTYEIDTYVYDYGKIAVNYTVLVNNKRVYEKRVTSE